MTMDFKEMKRYKKTILVMMLVSILSTILINWVNKWALSQTVALILSILTCGIYLLFPRENYFNTNYHFKARKSPNKQILLRFSLLILLAAFIEILAF